jgi:hypothetical protein
MSAYKIEVSITPLCSSCGEELCVGLTESKTIHHPFERDNPYERKDRRVFITPCEKCFVYRGDVDPTFKATRAAWSEA